MNNNHLKSPIWWFGGKAIMIEKILPLLPPHKYYVEPFGGGGSILLAKEPSLVDTYNDIDDQLVEFFRVLRDKEKFQEFFRLVNLTPYSRKEFDFCKKEWKNGKDDIERSYRWYIMARMAFSGYMNENNTASFVVTTSSQGYAKSCAAFLNAIEGLPEIHNRLRMVQIECCDWRSILTRFNDEDHLAYCDPPYIPETRSCGEYRFELNAEDHKELVKVLLNYKGMVVLSGYDHEIYYPLTKNGWEMQCFETSCMAAARTKGTGILGKGSATAKQKRVEVIWRNPLAVRNASIQGIRIKDGIYQQSLL